MAKNKEKVAIQSAKYRKVSQEEFAKAVGVSQPNIGRYETGQIEPSLKILINIAKELNVTTDALLGLKQEQTSYSSNQQYTLKQQKLIKTIFSLSEQNQEKVQEYVSMLEKLEHTSNN